MASKLIYLPIDWETLTYLSVLKQVRGVITALQTSMMVHFTEVVSNVNLKTLIILAKRLILDGWLGLGCASAD